MRVTLIRPAYRTTGYDEGTQECLGIGYVGGMLRQEGHEVTVVDAEIERVHDDEAVVERIAASEPQLIGLSVMSEDTVDSLINITRRLKQLCPDVHMTAGGNLPSFAPEWIMRLCPDVDSVIRFEGEKPLAELAVRLSEGRDWRDVPGLCCAVDGVSIANPPSKPVDDLDSLPFPIRDTLPISLESGLMPPLSTSRGCHAKCSFCSVHQFNLDPARPWRFRSPTNVADEIERLVVEYGIEQVNFVDDDFIGNRRQGQPRARELAAQLLARQLNVGFSLQCRAEWIDYETFRPLKDAGLQMVFFGIESVDRVSQKRFRKGQTRELVERTLKLLKDLEVYTHIGFIMFNPWTTLEDLRDSIEFLHDAGHLNVHTITNYLQLSPGTPLLEPLLTEGVAYQEPGGQYNFNYADPRAASAKAVFDRVIWPLFPHWYESLMAKWSVLSRMLQVRDRTCEEILSRYDEIVYQLARDTLDAIEKDPAVDLFELVEALEAGCRQRLADIPQLPPSPYRRQPLLCAE